jgi:hypothetical protein
MAESYLNQEGAFYAERQPTDYVDWSKISKDLSETLNAEAKTRTELKAKLDEENRLAINKLQEAPQGEHKGANEFALETADNGSKYLLMLNKMLKSGQMSVRDYTIAVQNVKDGTNDTFSMLKEYQANYKDIMDRTKAGDNQLLELYTNSQIEGYGDFNKSQIYIDPSTGRMSIAMKEKKIVDGKEVYVMTENPNNIATVSSVRSQLKARYDKFDVDNATDAYVKSLGKQIEVVKAAGGYKNISDVTAKDDFYKAETNAINAMLANPLNRSSILTESKKFTDDGIQYTYTYDKTEAEKDPSKILLRLDPKSNFAMPDFESTANGRKQMEMATEWVRQQARTKYDKETKFQEVAPRYAPEYVYERGDRKKMEESALDNFNKIYYGTNKEKQAAVDAFIENSKMFNKGLIDIDLESKPGYVIFKYDNPKLDNEKKLYDPKTKEHMSKKDWASIGGEILEISQEQVNSSANKMRDIDFNTSGVRAKRGSEGKAKAKEDYSEEVNKYVEENIDIVEDDPEATIKLLQSKLGNKFSIGGGTRGVTRTDYITIGNKEFIIDNKKDLGKLKAYLKEEMDKSVNPYGETETKGGLDYKNL